MFVLNRNRIVKWPVDVPVARDGGVIETQRFTAHFKLLPDSEVRALVDRDADNRALLRAVLVDTEDARVEGAVDGTGAGPDFAAFRELLLDCQSVRYALIRGYFQALQGAAPKNVVTPPASGPAASSTAAAAASSPTT